MEYYGLKRTLEVTWTTPICSPKRVFAGLTAEDHNSSEAKQTVNPTGDCIDHGSKLHSWRWKDTKTMLKKIHLERMTTGSQIAVYQSVKCNKPMILWVISPPGLFAAKCIIIFIITVCDCHLLLSSQGLLHKKISSYFLYCYYLNEELSTSFRPRMRHLFGSSQRAQKELKLVDSISSISALWRSYWKIQLLRVGSHGQWDSALLDPVQLKRQFQENPTADQGDKKSLKSDTYYRAKQILILIEWPEFAPAIKWATHTSHL